MIKYDSIEVTWASNGRVLPTQAERDMMTLACESAADVVNRRGVCKDASEMEIAIVSEIENFPDSFALEGLTRRDIKRIMADANVSVVE